MFNDALGCVLVFVGCVWVSNDVPGLVPGLFVVCVLVLLFMFVMLLLCCIALSILYYLTGPSFSSSVSLMQNVRPRQHDRLAVGCNKKKKKKEKKDNLF